MRTSLPPHFLPPHWMVILAVSALIATASPGVRIAQADPDAGVAGMQAATAGPACAVSSDSRASGGELAAVWEELAKEAGASGGALRNGHPANYGAPVRVENELIDLEAALQAAE